MTVRDDLFLKYPSAVGSYPSLVGLNTGASPKQDHQGSPFHSMFSTQRVTRNFAKLRFGALKDIGTPGPSTRRHAIPRPNTFVQVPDVGDVQVSVDENAEYAVVVSMYEVYNDRIFDLLSGQASSASSKYAAQRDLRRRALLFKSTEQSPDRKVVAGLKKVICGTLDEALTVLEAGLMERRVAGTGSNSVSSRSHGFFCVEVKKRVRYPSAPWVGTTLTIVDLAGSERARDAKTAGATLAEAGKINESLMYLGQCLQMQSDSHAGGSKVSYPPRKSSMKC